MDVLPGAYAVLLYFLVVCVDYIFFALGFAVALGLAIARLRFGAVARRLLRAAGLLASLAVHRLRELVRCLGESLGGLVEFRGLLGFELALGRGQRLFDILARGLVELRAVILERLFGRIDEVVELVA